MTRHQRQTAIAALCEIQDALLQSSPTADRWISWQAALDRVRTELSARRPLARTLQ